MRFMGTIVPVTENIARLFRYFCHYFSGTVWHYQNLVRPVIEIETVNFSALLTDLNGWGWSDYKLADEIDMSRSAVTKLRNGERGEPAYNAGCRIVKLHKRERRKQG